MIRTILVPTSGTDTDDRVFATALGLARPLGAHLEFFHQRLTDYEAALRTPAVQFCPGAAIGNALEHLRQRDEQLCSTAAEHVRKFCEGNGLALRAAPAVPESVSASWTQETDLPEQRFMLHSRHSDLVVLGRPRHADLMPSSLIETLLMDCGRPIVIAPETLPGSVSGTVVVGWKEAPEAARALAAAVPLLARARRVVLLSVTEDGSASPQALRHLAHQLAWHGIVAEVRIIGDGAQPVRLQLPQAAAELHADLLVVGGFGHRPLRELVFGGVTRTLLDRAALPVFMQH